MMLFLEWSGAVLGGAGALVLACNQPWSKWGWALFLASNLLIITFAWLSGLYGMMTMMIVMMGTSILGIQRWIIAPLRAPPDQ